MLDIPNSSDWARVEKLDKGWMPVSKYRIETKSGARMKLELSPFAYQEKKSALFHLLGRLTTLDLHVPAPIGMGVYQQNTSVYTLLGWVEGEPLREILPACPVAIQYELGRKAGAVLRKMHGLPMESKRYPAEPVSKRILSQLQRYEISRLRFGGDEGGIAHIKAHIGDVCRLPYGGLHGDFQPGGLVLTPEGEIGVLDLDHWRMGDPMEDFARLESCGQGPELSPAYCRGQVDGYCGGTPPIEFWNGLGVYVASAALYNIIRGEGRSHEELARMTTRCKQIFARYQGFAEAIPDWYRT